MNTIKIDTRIPFSPDGNLGAEYNRIIQESNSKWILLLDHDVLIMNPHWHHICSKVIEQYPETGLFTCYTNNIGNTAQKSADCPDKHAPILDHRLYARELFLKNGFSCTEMKDKCSGMFLLVNKEVWKKVGGFNKIGLFKTDWDFAKLLTKKKHKIRRIDGLYVYHIRDRELGSWIDGEITSKEIRDSRMKHRDK